MATKNKSKKKKKNTEERISLIEFLATADQMKMWVLFQKGMVTEIIHVLTRHYKRGRENAIKFHVERNCFKHISILRFQYISYVDKCYSKQKHEKDN